MSADPRAVTGAYADADGDRIHFIDQGDGSSLLLVHGAFSRGAEFLGTEFGAFLAPRYRIIAPDSLGHGASDAPRDRTRYGARRRASQLVSVLDALNIERAHVVGYSMGGWMASALATFYPERLASLAIGGWDVVRGMYTPAAAWGMPEITGEILIEMARAEHPELADWVRPEDEKALGAAIEGMNDLDGLAEGVARCGAPVALWCGRDDLYHEAVAAFATANGFAMLSLPGDHNTMLYEHGKAAAERVNAFIQANAR